MIKSQTTGWGWIRAVSYLAYVAALAVVIRGGNVQAQDFQSVTNLSDLEELVNQPWTNTTILMPPGSFPYTTDLGVMSYQDGFAPDFLSTLIPVTNSEVEMFTVVVIETNTTPRQRFYLNSEGVAAHTTTVSMAGYPSNSIVATYGAVPSYLTGTNLTEWFDERDPIRQTITLTLLSQSNAAAYYAAITNALGFSQDTNTVNLMEIYSNDIAFVKTASREGGGFEYYLHAPTNISRLNLFVSTNLTDKLGGWSLPATLNHASDPLHGFYFGALSPFFIAAADPAVDSDNDGLSDCLEIRLFGTNPDNPDSDQDGLLDGAETLTYGTSPLLVDSDGDGLSDAWEVAMRLNPLDADDYPYSVALGSWFSGSVDVRNFQSYGSNCQVTITCQSSAMFFDVNTNVFTTNITENSNFDIYLNTVAPSPGINTDKVTTIFSAGTWSTTSSWYYTVVALEGLTNSHYAAVGADDLYRATYIPTTIPTNCAPLLGYSLVWRGGGTPGSADYTNQFTTEFSAGVYTVKCINAWSQGLTNAEVCFENVVKLNFIRQDNSEIPYSGSNACLMVSKFVTTENFPGSSATFDGTPGVNPDVDTFRVQIKGVSPENCPTVRLECPTAPFSFEDDMVAGVISNVAAHRSSMYYRPVSNVKDGVYARPRVKPGDTVTATLVLYGKDICSNSLPVGRPASETSMNAVRKAQCRFVLMDDPAVTNDPAYTEQKLQESFAQISVIPECTTESAKFSFVTNVINVAGDAAGEGEIALTVKGVTISNFPIATSGRTSYIQVAEDIASQINSALGTNISRAVIIREDVKYAYIIVDRGHDAAITIDDMRLLGTINIGKPPVTLNDGSLTADERYMILANYVDDESNTVDMLLVSQDLPYREGQEEKHALGLAFTMSSMGTNSFIKNSVIIKADQHLLDSCYLVPAHELAHTLIHDEHLADVHNLLYATAAEDSVDGPKRLTVDQHILSRVRSDGTLLQR